jgi:hypothetical protein
MSSRLNQKLSTFRTAAIAVSLAAGLIALPAIAQEQAAAPAVSPQIAAQSLGMFSSSVSGDESANPVVDSTPHFGPNAAADPQYGGGYGGPPPRRPYGRPTYKDKSTNSDGSTKIAFEAGAGFNHPAGSTQNYQTTGWNISVGAGRNFNRALGVLLQYDYDNMGLPGYILDAFSASQNTQVTGNTHLWSITANPVISFSDPHAHVGAYIVFGGGFYRKLTNLQEPGVGEYCDPYYGCYYTTVNQTVAHWSNNAGGVNGGLGLTYKFSSYSNAKLFMEARYTWVDNMASPNNTAANGYPPNNYHTMYFPVTFGIRF